MQITRIQVEEGFLNAFDLRPSPGLNVLIGARGTGKTSVIELLRFALGARNHTKDAEEKSLVHARAVLQGGEITVELKGDDDVAVLVSRGAEDESPTSNKPFQAPIVLSQTEIETVGLSEAGRLALLDGFIINRAEINSEEAKIVGLIRSAFKEVKTLDAEIGALEGGGLTLLALTDQIRTLQSESERLLKGTVVSEAKQKKLNDLSQQIAQLTIKGEMVGNFKQSAGNWGNSLEELLGSDIGGLPWEGAMSADPLADLRPTYVSALKEIEKAKKSFDLAWQLALTRQDELLSRKLELEKSSRTMRNELDSLAQGVGAVTRQLSTAQTQVAQLQARDAQVKDKKNLLKKLRTRRNELLTELELIRSKRSEARETVAKRINAALSPHIQIEMQNSAQYAEYSQAISNALRGSGMKYAELSSKIAEEVSPAELIEFVEAGDFNVLAKVLGMPGERAARLLGHLRDFGLAEIATCLVEDNVRMTLLDGVGYKDISTLSAGQRCTVVLSVVLQHDERTLVIDQPEDHLDNAFITSTVIKALRERKGSGQVILSTHNANIPVLGEADLVVELTSDGRNGFIQLCAPLEHPQAVEAISNVMEGGRDAFSRRADFYRKNSSD
jgi:DNA repair exonuclease SbcCD ATPase subunit